MNTESACRASAPRLAVLLLLRSRRAGRRHGAAQLNTLYAEFWEENLKLNPITATFAGDPRYNAELPNFLAPEFEKQTRAFEQKYLDRARAIGTEGPHRPGPALVRHLHAQSRIGARGAEVSRPAAAHRPVPQHRQLLRAVRLRHERAAVRDRQGLRRLAEARGAEPGDLRPGHREHARGREGRHRAAARAHGEGAAAARRQHRRRCRRRASSGVRSRRCRRSSPRPIANA